MAHRLWSSCSSTLLDHLWPTKEEVFVNLLSFVVVVVVIVVVIVVLLVIIMGTMLLLLSLLLLSFWCEQLTIFQ